MRIFSPHLSTLNEENDMNDSTLVLGVKEAEEARSKEEFSPDLSTLKEEDWIHH